MEKKKYVTFNKHLNRLWKYLYISSFCFLMFTFACFLYNYRNLYDEGGQVYYMDGIKLQTFKEKYTNLYSINMDSTDYFIFHEPYNGKFEKIEYMGKDYMVLKSRKNKGSKPSPGLINQKKLVEWFGKPANEEVEITFKGRIPKADLDKLNAKECTNTLVF